MNSSTSSQKIVAALGVAAVGALLAGYLWNRRKGTATATTKATKQELKKDNNNINNNNNDGDIDAEFEDEAAKAKRMKDEGNAAFKVGDFENAIECYSEGIKLSQDKEDVHLLYSNRSAAYAAMKNYTAAMDDAVKCIELKPEWFKGYIRMGKVLLATGKYDEAFMNYYKGTKHDPTNEELRKVLEVTRMELGIGDYDSRSKVDSKMIRLFFKQQLSKFADDGKVDYKTIKNAVKKAIEDKITEATVLDQEPFKTAYNNNKLSTLRLLSQLFTDNGSPDVGLALAQKALEMEPENHNVMQLLTSAMLRKNASAKKTLETIRQALKIDPKSVLVAHTYASVLLRISQSNEPLSAQETRAVLRELQGTLKNPDTNHLLIADCGIRLWFKLFEDPQIQQMLMAEEQENMIKQLPPNDAYIKGLTKGAFSKLCLEPFFVQALSQIVFNNPGLERVLSPFRTAFASLSWDDSKGQIYETLSPLMEAMALQCYRNGYIWVHTPEDDRLLTGQLDSLNALLENKNADHLVTDGVLDKELSFYLTIVALYESLSTVDGLYEVVSKADLSKLSPSLGLLLKKTVLNPRKENEIKQELEFYKKTEISSPLVDYYNSHIGVTWDSSGVAAGRMVRITLAQELQWIHPKYTPSIDVTKKLKVLVAGCGSGCEIAQIATIYENLDITAIDVSSVNLAYAKRQNAELNVEAKFELADILNLEPSQFPELFDVVIAQGVLPHLKDPLKGWEKLVSVMKTGGLIRLSLFNRRYLEFIATCRNFLSSKFHSKPLFDNNNQLPKLIRTPTLEEIRTARNYLLESERPDIEEEILQIPAFYSLNEFIELVFHPQLISYTFESVGDAIERLGLKLVGFEFPQILQENVLRYRVDYPDDPDMKNYEYLDEFESRNPDAFRNIASSIFLTCEKL